MMAAKLYVILGSHACRTGMLLLEHKGIDYEAVRVPTAFQGPFMRLLGFPGNPEPFREIDGRPARGLAPFDRLGTVPSLKLNGQKVKQNREIARFLDDFKPDPPLFPSNPELRQKVEEAEAWGDEVLQMEARRVLLTAAVRGFDRVHNHGDDGRLGTLLWRNRRIRRAGARFIARRAFRATPRHEPEVLAELPGLLDRVDAWIGEGVLNAQQLNAADYMIVTSLALISYRNDIRPELERRPLIKLLDRVLPEPA